MTPQEKLASFIEKELGEPLEKESAAIAGRLFGGLARGAAKVKQVATTPIGPKGGLMASIKSKFRTGYSQGRHGITPPTTPKAELAQMSRQREVGIQPTVTTKVRTPSGRVSKTKGGVFGKHKKRKAESLTPNVERLRQVRAGAPPASPPPPSKTPVAAGSPSKPDAGPKGPVGGKKPTKKPASSGMGGAVLTGATMGVGGGGQQQTPQAAFGPVRMASPLDEILEKAGVMTNDQVEQLIITSMETGFSAHMEKEAKGYGYKPKAKKADAPAPEEKTASMGKRAKGILYSKYTVQDLVEHLAGEYGREEPIEKEAAATPALKKFAGMLKEELSRPT